MRLSTKVVIDTRGIEAVVTAAKKRDITLQGAKAAARILKAAAKSAAPKRPRSGALKQAQGVKAAKGTKGQTASYAVQGSRKKVVKMVRLPGHKKPTRVIPAFYDHLVQLGTKPHSIGKGESLGRSGKRKTVARTAQTGRKHPGARPNPFRKRAWELVKGAAAAAAIAAMAVATRKEIARQVAKYGRPKG